MCVGRNAEGSFADVAHARKLPPIQALAGHQDNFATGGNSTGGITAANAVRALILLTDPALTLIALQILTFQQATDLKSAVQRAIAGISLVLEPAYLWLMSFSISCAGPYHELVHGPQQQRDPGGRHRRSERERFHDCLELL